MRERTRATTIRTPVTVIGIGPSRGPSAGLVRSADPDQFGSLRRSLISGEGSRADTIVASQGDTNADRATCADVRAGAAANLRRTRLLLPLHTQEPRPPRPHRNPVADRGPDPPAPPPHAAPRPARH